MGWDLSLIAIVLLAYAMVSGRIQTTVLTPAIVFVAVGYVLGSEGLDVFELSPDSGTVRTLAEVTLGLVLFTDASTLDTRALSREVGLPARLLGIGLPLMIVVGAVTALVMFPDLGFFEALVLAILLAPTDAALGQAVVSDRRLPSRLRQGLNVESGLNDGVCVPLLFAALAFVEIDEAPGFDGGVLVDLVEEVSVAVAVGVAVALAVATAAAVSERRGWIQEHWGQIVPLATAATAYAVTAELGGSGFIGAFVAGLTYRQRLGAHRAHESTRLMEDVGGVLSAVTFFVFGATLIGKGVVDLDVATVTYAALSLTVLRMAPVALSFVGSGVSLATSAFAGWFGPRGLATIVFALTVVEDADLPGAETVLQVATVTVVLSVVAHGVTARPLTDRFVRTESAPPATAEHETDAHLPRRGIWHHRRN